MLRTIVLGNWSKTRTNSFLEMGKSSSNVLNVFKGSSLTGHHVKGKVKSSMARSLPVENQLPQNVGSIINYLQYTIAAQWGTPSCSQPQPATDNGVRDGRSN